MTPALPTLAHVTHEAVEQIGGIGAVLDGLITSPLYHERVGRTILIGPTQATPGVDPTTRLGPGSKVRYSSIDRYDPEHLGPTLRPVEWAFQTPMVYGTRTLEPPGQGRTAEVEVLLIDVNHPDLNRIGGVKAVLYEQFGLASETHQHDWSFEEYVRLAGPALYALHALLPKDDSPCVVLAHEYMGLPTALLAKAEGGLRVRTVFHAHECATARSVVEGRPGHDTMFYAALDLARAQGQSIEAVFPEIAGYMRHQLIKLAHHCDAIAAVGPRTKDEMHFLSAELRSQEVDLVYNGIPAASVSLDDKQRSREALRDALETMTGARPDLILTHVTRPVISKAMWRDLTLCSHLNAKLAQAGETGTLIMLTTGGGVRAPEQVRQMHEDYGWPKNHRHGYPDLVGPEQELWNIIEPFNAKHDALQIVLVNQFGWTRSRVGPALPTGMGIADLRVGTDIELGMACYEPFGISPLEPMYAGAICLISDCCGCLGWSKRAAKQAGLTTAEPNVFTADFSPLSKPSSLEAALSIGEPERVEVEQARLATLAEQVWSALPQNETQRQALLDRGQALVQHMGWDAVMRDMMGPLLDRL